MNLLMNKWTFWRVIELLQSKRWWVNFADDSVWPKMSSPLLNPKSKHSSASELFPRLYLTTLIFGDSPSIFFIYTIFSSFYTRNYDYLRFSFTLESLSYTRRYFYFYFLQYKWFLYVNSSSIIYHSFFFFCSYIIFPFPK